MTKTDLSKISIADINQKALNLQLALSTSDYVTINKNHAKHLIMALQDYKMLIASRSAMRESLERLLRGGYD